MRPAGIEQYPLGRRRFTGVDVSHDPNISVLLERSLASHDLHAIGVSDLPLPYQR